MKVRKSKKNVLIITNIPNPYRIPLFNELNKQLENKGLHLKVLFGALGYERRKWIVNMDECEFDFKVLPSKTIRYSDNEKISFTYAGLYRILSQESPIVTITNAFSIATTKLWLRSWFKKTPYIIWSGAFENNYEPDSLLRKLLRMMLVKRATGFIAYGTKAKDYLVSLGADENKVEIGINTVDTNFYLKQTKKLENYIKRNNGSQHLLYVGYLSKRKNILNLLISIRKLSQLRSDFVLDIVGDGNDKERLKKYVLDNHMAEFVKFHGFKGKEFISKFMTESDCFLFQTDFDPWGLVLVEAMAVGLPCISSINAGATYDLITEGTTGFVMDFSDTDNVIDKIIWILNNPRLSRKIGQNARHFIEENVSLKKSANGFIKAISKSLNI